MRGFYCLVMRLERDAEIDVGQKGRGHFPAGFYVYCGSALGGVNARLARHLRADRRTHWHIDYLLPLTTVVDMWAGSCAERLECLCAACIHSLPDATLAFPGFGASDCRCPGHLVWLPYSPPLSEVNQRLRASRPEAGLTAAIV